ncbi:MAG: hypothetical protein J6S11_05295 [Bacteroidaceae bacterium]|nr:hypothetical protein [Bacteroidaceae bacterium]
MNNTKTLKCELRDGLRFTGRQISSKLVISKNKDANGKSVTFIFAWRNNMFFFIPIADIYLDANNRELIMPKGKPVQVAQGLYTDIIPSMKYKGYYVLSPDSDYNPIFKEVELFDGRRVWLMAYDELVLHLYSWLVEYDDEEEWKEDYLSMHQIKARERIEAKKEHERNKELYRMAREMTDELFEEAGYDFMD